MCLDSALDLWPPSHFELGFFPSRIGCSEMGVCGLVVLLGVVNLEMDNSFKWLLFNIVSGHKRRNAM